MIHISMKLSVTGRVTQLSLETVQLDSFVCKTNPKKFPSYKMMFGLRAFTALWPGYMAW